MSARAPASLQLTDPVSSVPGVGPRSVERLAAAGVRTVLDLLRLWPSRRRRVLWLEAPRPECCEQWVRLEGEVRRVALQFLPGRRNLVRVHVDCGGVVLQALFFNQPYLKKRFVAGQWLEWCGVLRQRGASFFLASPRARASGQDGQTPADGAAELEPIYPAVPGIQPQRLRQFITAALRAAPLGDWPEPLPAALRRALDVPDPALACQWLHRPADAAQEAAAHRRFALEEAMDLLRAAARRRQARSALRALALPADARLRTRILARIPFALTSDQARALDEVLADLARPRPMARLLQGEVGSGKTAVAVAALLAAVAHGAQAVLMAPTELLAQQHAERLRGWLAGAQVRIELLTGSQPAPARAQTLALLREGAPGIWVGTHALLSEPVAPARLALCVIDEQHRFGVEQRARLSALGPAPHVLVMTATPIPRTLATTLFGDLDVSQIAQLPPGRRPVRTRVLATSAWPRVLRAVLREVARGGKVFVVSPRIDGGAEALHAELARHTPTLLAHGRMPPAERLAAAQAFRAGAARVLVGSTVLEVGLDVGDATWMVVVDAHRLGLAALHQLRGRVGRGGRRALCLLLGERSARLDLLARCRDGFALAEADLRLRGPGELFGAQQSGFPRFRLLDPLADLPLLVAARDACAAETAPAAPLTTAGGSAAAADLRQSPS